MFRAKLAFFMTGAPRSHRQYSPTCSEFYPKEKILRRVILTTGSDYIYVPSEVNALVVGTGFRFSLPKLLRSLFPFKELNLKKKETLKSSDAIEEYS